MTAIQKFYKNQIVFITGGTGFLGKVLLAKLLRETEVHLIYLLIREKTNKTPKQRLQDMLENEFFQELQNQAKSRGHLDFSKVKAVSGDCSLPDLGLSEANRNLLLNKVNIIFHCAATVRLMEPLRNALKINVLSTQKILELGKQMLNLKSFVHLSTAFVHCTKPDIVECIIDTMEVSLSGANACKLIDIMDDKMLDKLTPQLLDLYPNTYAYTKSLAENIIATHVQDMPICVFRPVAVVSTYMDPVPGWVDNFYFMLGLIVGMMLGQMHVIRYRRSQEALIVPVDYCVNAMIASGLSAAQERRNFDTSPTVFNYAPDSANPTTWGEYYDTALAFTRENPPKSIFWYPFMFATESIFKRQLLRTLLHTMPAFFADLWASYRGKKLRLAPIYKRMHNVNDQLDCVSMKDFRIANSNVRNLWNSLSEQDKQLFPFDMMQVDWKQQHMASVIGLRRYMLKEGPETIEAGRKRYRKLLCLHLLVLLSLLSLSILALCYFVF